MKTIQNIIRNTTLILLLTFLPGGLFTCCSFAQGTAFTYQGRVTDNGTNFTGLGQFKFALVTSTNASSQATATANLSSDGSGHYYVSSYAVGSGGNGYVTAPNVIVSGGGGSGATAIAVINGGVVTAINPQNVGSGYTGTPTVTIDAPPPNILYTTYWSNDGTSSDGSEPSSAVTMPVTNGLFTVVLGDTTLANMSAMNASLFTQPNLQLRIWFNDGVSGFAALDPAQNLTPAPYAMMANSASNLVGTLPAVQLNGTIAPANLPDGLGGSGNTASGQGSTVGGGQGNLATGNTNGSYYGQATVSGGYYNTASGAAAAVGGGQNNHASGLMSTVGGGHSNTAGGDYSTIGGGYLNIANGTNATIAGGINNSALGRSSFAAGQFAKALHDGTFVWADSQNANFSSTTNDQFSVRAHGGVRFETAGARMTLDGLPVLTIASPFGLTLQQNSNGAPNVIEGSPTNYVAAGVVGATIGGGYYNKAEGSWSTVAGGDHNQATNDSATVGGGSSNTAQGNDATIAGGFHNGTTIDYATVGGGMGNIVRGPVGTIAGGRNNLVYGVGFAATVGGGSYNEATNDAATVPGGFGNLAGGQYSFAAGNNARALHKGAFVWADSQNGTFSSTANDQFLIRAQGGVGINTTNPNGALAVNTGVGTLTVRNDAGLTPGIDIANGYQGTLRLRNAMEVWPSDDQTRAGRLDVRDTNGSPTITLDGQTGDLTANNTPGVNWAQNNNENITITSSATNLGSEGNAKPAPGYFVITAYASGNFNGNIVYLRLEDVTATPVELTYATSTGPVTVAGASDGSVSLSWVVPITAAGGYENFALYANTYSGTSYITHHNLTVMYFPRQNN